MTSPPRDDQPQWNPPHEQSPQYGGPQYGGPQYGAPNPGGWHSGGWSPTPPPPKPGVIALRPLGIGEVLDGALSAVRARPAIMFGFAAILAIFTQTLGVVASLLLGAGFDPLVALEDPAASGSDPFAAMDVGQLIAAGVVLVFSLLVEQFGVLVLAGLLAVVVSRLVLGHSLTVGQAWHLTARRLLPLIALGLLYVVALVAIVAIFVVGVAVAVASGGGIAAVVAVLLFAAAIPAFLFLLGITILFNLATPVVVLEEQGPVSALRRVWTLSQTLRWRTIGISLLIMLITTMLGGVLAAPFAVPGAFLTEPSGALSPLGLLLTAIGGVFAAVVVWPFSAVASTLIYIDLRMRREGLDLVLAKQAEADGGGSSSPNPTAGSPDSPSPFFPEYDSQPGHQQASRPSQQSGWNQPGYGYTEPPQR